MKLIKLLLATALALLVMACGGGGGNASAPPAAPDPSSVKNVAGIITGLDKVKINNTGNDKATLTVTVVDDKNNIVAGVPVSVVLDAGVYTPTSTTTDASGQVTGGITIGHDSAATQINLQITATGTTATGATTSIQKSTTLAVSGNNLTLVLSPNSVSLGRNVSMDAITTDGAGNPVGGVAVALSGIPGAPTSVMTNATTGIGTVTFTAPANAGTYTISGTATAFTAASSVLTVTNPATVQLPMSPDPLKVVISTASLVPRTATIQPNVIQSDGQLSTVNRAIIDAKFQTAANVGIPGIRVVFFIAGNPLGNGEALIPANPSTTPPPVVLSDVVYTDSSGVASVQYVAGTRVSPTDGVVIQACYSYADFPDSNFLPSGNCANTLYPNFNSTPPVIVPPTPAGRLQGTLTVAKSALSISIGDNNILQTSGGGVGYLKQFLIQVNDAAGVAVQDAIVSLSVDITHYGKGVAWPDYKTTFYPISTPPTRDYGAYAREPVSSVVSGVPTITMTLFKDPVDPATLVPTTHTADHFDPKGTIYDIWCPNEDFNRNGFMDTGEDVNGSGSIEPRKADIIISYVNGNKTDATGQLLAQVTYPQSVGRWLAYTVRASTAVGGSQGDASRDFITDVLAGDESNGSFLTPPYGSGACNDKY